MDKKHRFIISYLRENQPESVNLESEAETLSQEDARRYLEAMNIPGDEISDIQIMGMHHPLRPEVRPGHYQQPEGNGG